MNIGILTYFSVPNFGAQLQALSTVGYFKKNGDNPILINWYPKSLEQYYERIISNKQIKMHDEFSLEYLPVTERCFTEDQVVDVIVKNNIEAIFIGSDALLKFMPKRLETLIRIKHFITKNKELFVVTDDRKISTPFVGNFYEKLPSKLPMVMFSVSSQDSRYKYLNLHERKIIKKELKNFTYITVRDNHTRNLVNSFLKLKNLKITPDPVFNFNDNTSFINLPTKDDIIKKYKLPDNYVLYSFRSRKFKIDNEYSGVIARRLLDNGLSLVAFPHPDGVQEFDLDLKIDIPLPIIDWYCLIRYSAGYIGERMHPIVVCLHNNVPFVVFDEYGNNSEKNNTSKIYHILDKADLTEYRFGVMDDYSNPNKVVDRFLNFDTKKEASFGKKQSAEYVDEMNKILKIFKRKGINE